MTPDNAHILDEFGLTAADLIGEGGESRVYALGRDLGLSIVPRSFICVDISHNQGRDTKKTERLALRHLRVRIR